MEKVRGKESIKNPKRRKVRKEKVKAKARGTGKTVMEKGRDPGKEMEKEKDMGKEKEKDTGKNIQH
jgi:hypothetical protein